MRKRGSKEPLKIEENHVLGELQIVSYSQCWWRDRWSWLCGWGVRGRLQRNLNSKEQEIHSALIVHGVRASKFTPSLNFTCDLQVSCHGICRHTRENAWRAENLSCRTGTGGHTRWHSVLLSQLSCHKQASFSQPSQGHVVWNVVLCVGAVAIWSPSLLLKCWPVSRAPQSVLCLIKKTYVGWP